VHLFGFIVRIYLFVFIYWPKINGASQLTFYADDVIILRGSVHNVGLQRTDALVIVSKETSLEVNAEKSKYVIMSGGQNAGQNQSIKIDNNVFERVEQFQYW
jgi:hypothetical protein